MFNCIRPRRSSFDSQLYSQLLGHVFDKKPAEVRITREYTPDPLPDLDSSDGQPVQPFPRMSIASDASIGAVCPASCQRSAGTASPDNYPLPPRPTSPIQIVNDLDNGDELTYPTSYRHLKVDTHYPAYSVDWFIMQRPPLQIRKGLLVELVLKHAEGTLITRACLARISHVGPTWVYFCAEREDALGSAVKKVQLVVPQVWSKLPPYHSILSFFCCHHSFDIHEPFDPASDRQISYHTFTLPANVDPDDVEKVIQLRRWACRVDILTGREKYVI